MNEKSIGANLSSKVRRSVQSGKLMPAVVIESYFDKVTVQMGGNGQLMRNLPIVGGPVDVGAKVNIDFSTTPPQVVAKGNAYVTAKDLENAVKGINSTSIKREAAISVTLFSGGSLQKSYAASADGLTEAMADANEGDVVWLPDTEIALNLVVKDGVGVAGISSRQSLIIGSITLGSNSSLENLKIIATDDVDLVGVTVNPAEVVEDTLPAFIKGCEIHAYACSSNQATAISMNTGALLDISYSVVTGHSESGLGYAIEFSSGCHIEATYTRFWATTSWYTGTGDISEYANTEGFEESLMWCNPPQIPFYSIFSGTSGFGTGQVVGGEKISEMPISAGYENLDVSGGLYIHSFQRLGGYLYYSYYKTGPTRVYVREVEIATGTMTDIEIPDGSNGFGQFVVAEERKCLATAHTGIPDSVGDKYRIYVLDFSDSSSTLEYEHDFSVLYGTNHGGTGQQYDYLENYHFNTPTAIRTSGGDVVIAVVGTVVTGIRYGVMYPSSTSNIIGAAESRVGRYVLTKNWTQGGDWTMQRGYITPLDNDFGTWAEEQINNDNSALNDWNDNPFFVVADRYIVWPSNVHKGYTVPPTMVDYYFQTIPVDHFINPSGSDMNWTVPTSDENDYLLSDEIIGFFLYDLQEETFTFYSDSYSKTGIWGNGLDLWTGPYVGIDHMSPAVYLTTSPSNEEGWSYERVWKLDIVGGTLSSYHDSPDGDTDVVIVSNRGHCLLMESATGADWNILEARDLTTFNADLVMSDVNAIWNMIDVFLDDDSNALWIVDHANRKFQGINLLSGSIEEFDIPAGFTIPDDGFSKGLCLGNVFLVSTYVSGSPHWYLIKDTV